VGRQVGAGNSLWDMWYEKLCVNQNALWHPGIAGQATRCPLRGIQTNVRMTMPLCGWKERPWCSLE